MSTNQMDIPVDKHVYKHIVVSFINVVVRLSLNIGHACPLLCDKPIKVD